MAAKDYRLMLKASLDPTGLDKEIENVSKKYKLNLKISVDETAVNSVTDKINKIASTGKSKVKLIDPNAEIKSLEAIQARITELQQGGKNVKVTSTFGASGDITGKVLQYRDALNKTTTETYKLADATTTSNDMVKTQTKTVEGSTRSISTWTDGLSTAISRTLQYATSVGLIYGALAQLKEGIQYIKDLNKEMTNIQVLQVGGAQTKEEIESLALSFNSLAKALGATTIEVAQGSTEWLFNQGHLKLL